MTEEMGKPLAQAEGEVVKCAQYIEYSIKHSLAFMEDEVL
jgi:acyl-CoA reductase-like NAD-dependent aldehyde dehydrogenase